MPRKIILVIMIVVLAAGAGIFWKVRDTQARESEILKALTADDVVLMLQNQALAEPSRTHAVVQSPETRAIFLSKLKEYLALAAKARREGLADDPNIKTTLEYKTNQLLASIYQNKLDNDLKQYYEIPREQIDSFLSDPENEKQFQSEMRALRSVQKAVAENSGNPTAAPELSAATMEKTRKEWAKTMILSSTAKGDRDFMKQPGLQLRIKVAEAGVLAFNYLNKYWADKVKPSEAEINAYLADHPEYDTKRKVETAQMVLGRAKAGDDFAKLAEEFSEDRASKNNGGLYSDVGTGILWPEVEAAALRLGKGQIADNLVETKYGLHVVQLVDRKSARDESGSPVEKFSVRQILVRKTFEDPGPSKDPSAPPPFLTPREIASSAIQNEKRKKFIDEVIKAEMISLPEDFPFEITEDLKTAGTRWQEVRERIEEDKRQRSGGKNSSEQEGSR